MIISSPKLILASLIFIAPLQAYTWTKNEVQAGLGLLASGGIIWASEKLNESQMVKDGGKALGINPRDVGNVLGITTGLFSLSCLSGSPDRNKALIRMATRAPIAAAVSAVAFTSFAQEILRHIPVVGVYLTCKNHDCKGICTECKLTKAVTVVGLYKLVDTLLDGPSIPRSSSSIVEPGE